MGIELFFLSKKIKNRSLKKKKKNRFLERLFVKLHLRSVKTIEDTINFYYFFFSNTLNIIKSKKIQ